ncbi:hypothetical protein MTR67_010205, partial [Solanum verrucosum]
TGRREEGRGGDGQILEEKIKSGAAKILPEKLLFMESMVKMKGKVGSFSGVGWVCLGGCLYGIIIYTLNATSYSIK